MAVRLLLLWVLDRDVLYFQHPLRAVPVARSGPLCLVPVPSMAASEVMLDPSCGIGYPRVGLFSDTFTCRRAFTAHVFEQGAAEGIPVSALERIEHLLVFSHRFAPAVAFELIGCEAQLLDAADSFATLPPVRGFPPPAGRPRESPD